MNKLAIASLLAVTSIAWAKGDFESEFNKQIKELFPKALEKKDALLNNSFSDKKLGYVAMFCKKELADQKTLDLITQNIEQNIVSSTRHCDESYCLIAVKIAKQEFTELNEEIF